jgi:hypothetical protein
MRKNMKKLNRSVLAEGEATGHSHVLDSDVDVYECEDGTRQFKLIKPTKLLHEEHKPIKLPDSIVFKSDIVREFDPFEEEIRRVVD